jgi:hypothetical protein
MKGNLTHIQGEWKIRYFKDEKSYDPFYCGELIDIHPDSFQKLDTLKESKKVDFYEVIDYKINTTKNFAVILENETELWDIILNKLEKTFEIYIPTRAKNWIKNTYESPKEKKQRIQI